MKNNLTSIVAMVALSTALINCKPESVVVHDKDVELVAADGGETNPPLLANITAFIDIATSQATDTGYDPKKPTFKSLILSDFVSTFEVPLFMFSKDMSELNDVVVPDKLHVTSFADKAIISQVVKISCNIKEFQYDAFNAVPKSQNELSYIAHAPCDNNSNYGIAIEVKFPAMNKPNRVTYTVHFGTFSSELEPKPAPHYPLIGMVSYSQFKVMPLEW